MFRHPLVRSAVYRSATARIAAQSIWRWRRRPIARPTRTVVRGIWPRRPRGPTRGRLRARALGRPAQARGGLAAAAAFLQRAAELTPEPARRARRALAAAQAKQRAGALDAALRLLAFAEAGPLDELDQARAAAASRPDHVRRSHGAATHHSCCSRPRSGSSRSTARSLAIRTWMRWRRRCSPIGSRAAAGCARSPRRCSAATGASRRGTRARVRPPARRARRWSRSTATRPACRRSSARSHAFRARAAVLIEDALRWLWLACRAARALGDDASWDELTERQVRLARDAGALRAPAGRTGGALQRAALLRRPAAAAALVVETEAVAEATGSRMAPQGAILAALRGEEAEAIALIEAGGARWCSAARDSGSPPRSGRARFSSTASAATRRRWRPPSRPRATRTSWASRRGCRPSSSRRPCASAIAERAAGPLRRLQEISQRRRHGLGARRRSAFTRVAQRGRRRRAPLPRSDRRG